MAARYLLHFADGSQYGPIDREMLEAWHREGRIPPDALAWPEGAPEWLPVPTVLATPAPASPEPAPPAGEKAPEAGAGLASLGPDDTKPPRRASHRPRRTARAPRRGDSQGLRLVLLATAGAAVVVAVVGGLWALLQPVLAKRWAMAAIERYALADRRVVDTESGLAIELPSGWAALREDNPFVSPPGVRTRLAQPALEAFAVVRVEVRPQLMGDLDRHLDALIQERLPTRPSLRESGRSDVQLGRGRARLVRATWEEGLDKVQGAVLSWADGYRYFSLDAWAPEATGGSFLPAVEALARGVTPSGAVEARVREAVEKLAVEVPELSPPALRLLVEERLSRGESVDVVPLDGLRAVSRGLDALSQAEAAEMGQIYEQIWAPVPEAERVRLARLLQEAKRGRTIPAEEAQALRAVVKAGALALPEDQLARLRELSEKAVRKSRELP